MTRSPRFDTAGSWHHVMNRAIARRPLFETRNDVRYFLAALARSVHRGQVEIHAYTVLTTHYHLLLRSPVGALSEGMRRSQNDYVRWFNRGRKRDGPLVRGRFRSRLIDSTRYRAAVLRYIDRNPVSAGLVARPEDYPFGSALYYGQSKGPPWLSRSWVEQFVATSLERGDYAPTTYPRAFRSVDDEAIHELVETRLLSSPAARRDDLDLLVDAAPEAVRGWFARKARLADGQRPFQPVASPALVRRSIDALRKARGEWRVSRRRKRLDGWKVLEAGLLRNLAATSFRDIGVRIGRSEQSAAVHCACHEQQMEENEGYASAAVDATRAVLARYA